MLFTVYAPTGEMFEVNARKAKDLIINHGWTVSPPELLHDLPLFAEPPAAPESQTRDEI